RFVVFSSDIELQNTNYKELVKDLLSIVTIFIARYNGLNEKEGGIISLNFGVRLFVTEHNSGGNVVEFCNNDFFRLSRLCVCHDKYQSL
ncbi:21797_t:CDS:2, partial [Dentiscutata erythropus]